MNSEIIAALYQLVADEQQPSETIVDTLKRIKAERDVCIEELKNRVAVDTLGVVEKYYAQVCARAEETIARTHQVSGAHYAAMQVEMAALRTDVTENHIDESLTPTIDRVKAMESLIEIGREMRDVLDADLLCPDCGKMDGHLSRCTAARWDMALQVERDSRKTATA